MLRFTRFSCRPVISRAAIAEGPPYNGPLGAMVAAVPDASLGISFSRAERYFGWSHVSLMGDQPHRTGIAGVSPLNHPALRAMLLRAAARTGYFNQALHC